ncbi:hypothetical protein ACFFGT_24835 [Mucilaginibacter angelicae]|uniref:WYL domain-containing protein n=1 Tax=Mucilaginibacter angelicae TaxID=869718 RepID=A0ABV6LDD4_9SPHI
MTFNKAKTLLTAIEYNLDGRMKYTYDLIDSNSFKLRMEDCVSGKVRYLSFELRSPKRGFIEVGFTCHDFRLNFPLIKNVESMTFNLYDFIKLIEYGIKIDENELHPEQDLNVEF